MTFAATHSALAQNTDDAHALCAQGGGDSPLSGAGGPNLNDVGDSAGGAASSFGSADSLGDSQAADADPESGSSGGAGGAGGGAGGGSGSGDDSAFSHAPSNDNAAGSGEFGSGAGLGGSDAGGGAGGCGPDIGEPVRRLPVTGGSSDRVGFMGAGFIVLGVTLVATRRRLGRRGASAPDGLVWDAFGTPTN